LRKRVEGQPVGVCLATVEAKTYAGLRLQLERALRLKIRLVALSWCYVGRPACSQLYTIEWKMRLRLVILPMTSTWKIVCASEMFVLGIFP
jgi:hypothetical protein